MSACKPAAFRPRRSSQALIRVAGDA